MGRLDARTACSWWADDPNNLGFDQDRLITVDLAKNPAAYLAGSISIADLQVDDAPCDGGLTKLGPTWPTGSTINGLWLESTFYDNLKNRPEFPQRFMSCYPYELTTAIYWAPASKGITQRFWGYHAEISSERGTLALCTIWTPGTAMTQKPAGSWWLDLATQADSIQNGLTTVGVGAVPKQGALFLDAVAARGLGLAGPKLPPWAGGQSIPRPKR
ncbi:MAG TPA: hypothetical protein VN253_00120 [Kofleriaceae bacterium]|nr:hypothetical protein [Kofleriaceae bacterium]